MTGLKFTSRAEIIKRVLNWMPDEEYEYEITFGTHDFKIEIIKKIERDT